MNLFDKCRKFDRAEEAHARGLLPYFHAISRTDHGTEVTMEGRRVLMIGSNNYLGLTDHPRVQEAALQAIRDYGTGCSGSRFLNGTLDLHHRLEAALADFFFGTEAALVFSTGFQTNLGVISVIAGKNDLIFCDRENHASIFDGARLAYGSIKKYRHNDMDELERLLAAAPRHPTLAACGPPSVIRDRVSGGGKRDRVGGGRGLVSGASGRGSVLAHEDRVGDRHPPVKGKLATLAACGRP